MDDYTAYKTYNYGENIIMKYEDFYNHWSSFIKNHPERKSPTHCFMSSQAYMDLKQNLPWRELDFQRDDCDFMFQSVKCFIVANENCPIAMVRI